MNTLFEVAYDEHGRLLILAEDVQRWLLDESLSWTALAMESSVWSVPYSHTSTILFGLQLQLDAVETVEFPFDDGGPDVAPDVG